MSEELTTIDMIAIAIGAIVFIIGCFAIQSACETKKK